MEDFDFLKAFTGVDILAVEGVARIAGRAFAVLFQEMTAAGLTDAQAIAIIKVTVFSVNAAIISSFPRGEE
jgi:hypothetical protein